MKNTIIKKFDLVQDIDGDIGIITEVIDDHEVFVKFLSCRGCGTYCFDDYCSAFGRLTIPTDVWIRYRLARFFMMAVAYIR